MTVRLSALRAGHPLPSRKIPATHFCYRLSRPEGHNAARKIRLIEKFSDLIGNRTRDLPVCSIVPQSINYRRRDLCKDSDTVTNLTIKSSLNFHSVVFMKVWQVLQVFSLLDYLTLISVSRLRRIDWRDDWSMVNSKRLWRKLSASNPRRFPGACLDGRRKTRKNLIRISRCLEQGSNWAHIKCKFRSLALHQPVQCEKFNFPLP
jgi:hypothetical protein